jgi:hypothetical protein
MENPAFTLPPEMILGLLGELSGSKNPHVKQFYELLAKHPAPGPAEPVLRRLLPLIQAYLLMCLVLALT